MSFVEKKPAQPNQSIIDGLMLLQAVAASDSPVGCTQLARQYGLDVTRVNRILGTLAYAGMARRTPGRKYIAGPGIHVLAAMSLTGSQLPAVALPRLQSLCEDTGLTATLGLLWRTRVVSLCSREPGAAGAAGIGRGLIDPAHCSAIGRILLAEYSPKELKSLYDENGPDESFAMSELQQSLREVQELGYATAGPPHSIAVAVGSPAAAGLSLSSPKKLPARRVPKLIGKLRLAAEAIGESLHGGATA